MTPLAHEIMKNRIEDNQGNMFSWLAGEKACRHFPDPYTHLRDVHFFEMTEVVPLVDAMSFQTVQKSSQVLAFLPAPRVWLEYRPSNAEKGGRLGFRLVQQPGSDFAEVELYVKQPDGAIVYRGVGFCLPLVGSANLGTIDTIIGSWASEVQGPHHYGLTCANMLYACLAMINTPRTIGSRTHQPHRGLEKALLKQRGFSAGKFPLHAWKEIKLEVRPPKDAGGEVIEAHLTGRRARHFVREHLRMWNGELIYVTWHWRGDAALGIERSRYSVVPGRAA